MGALSAINLLHPGLAVAGLAAGLVPLIIHLINRRRHRRVPWAAMAFLLTAARRRSRRMRLEQWLLFAVRVLVIVLIGLALARPYVTAARFLPVGQAHFHRVILLDNSGSMGASWHRLPACVSTGKMPVPHGSRPLSPQAASASHTAYDRARGVASALLDSFPQTDEVSVVSLASPATAVIDYPSFDRRRLRDALAQLPLTQRSTDLVGGLDRALVLLDKSSAAPHNRSVYVISDLAAHVCSGEVRTGDEATKQGVAQSPVLGPQSSEAVGAAAKRVARQAALVLVPVGETAATNAGISRLALGSTVTAVQVPVRFSAEVVNYGVTDLRDAKLQIRVATGEAHPADCVERRIVLPRLEPGQAETVSFSVVFDTPGAHAIHAHLEAGPTRPVGSPVPQDQLALDDDRWLALNVLEALNVLVVDGAPGKTRLSGQAGYLLTALNPWGASSAGGRNPEDSALSTQHSALVSPKAISDLELGGEVLSAYSVVVLCNVERLDEDMWKRLRRYVESGGGLLVFAGEAVNVDHYNRLGYAAGEGVLPAPLKPSEGTPLPPTLRGDAKNGASAVPEVGGRLGLALGLPVHPVVGDFEGLPASGLFAARIERRIPLALDAPAAEVVLRYTNQEPAMVICQRGAGRCGFVTTTADMAWNNLPAKGDYVSLMTNLVAYLAQPQVRGRNVEVGQPIVRRLAPDESTMPLHVCLPSGEVTDAAVSAVEDGFELRYAGSEQAGLHTTLVGSAAQTVAVNPPAAESDLKPLDPTTLAGIIDPPFTYIADKEELFVQATAPTARELGGTTFLIVFALLLCETWLAMYHGHSQDGERRHGWRRSLTPGTPHSGLSTHDA
ncbi:MAG: BatA domain-containing protein [Planctomycetota bacterium]